MLISINFLARSRIRTEGCKPLSQPISSMATSQAEQSSAERNTRTSKLECDETPTHAERLQMHLHCKTIAHLIPTSWYAAATKTKTQRSTIKQNLMHTMSTNFKALQYTNELNCCQQRVSKLQMHIFIYIFTLHWMCDMCMLYSWSRTAVHDSEFTYLHLVAAINRCSPLNFIYKTQKKQKKNIKLWKLFLNWGAYLSKCISVKWL